MKTREKIITAVISLIVLVVYFTLGSYGRLDTDILKIYNVYLDGKNIGSINNKESLYALIDKKQQDIKDRYNVSNVYPPNGLEIVENYSYTAELTDLNSIYNKIEELQDFTIQGYEIKVGKGTNHDEFSLYVLDKEVFNEAIKKFILSFVSEDELNNYLTDTQEELEIGSTKYMNMGFIEDITIKKTYISINEKIYKDSNELTQDLLFGFNHKEQTYKVKEGDTIRSIAEEHELNPQEILIANSKYSSEDSLLKIGDKLQIAYVLPEIEFSYTVQTMTKEVEEYNTDTKYDNTKPSSYNEITQAGVTGINIITAESTMINGKLASDVTIKNNEIIREKVDQIRTRGKKAYTSSWETFADTGDGWTWPTVRRYIVTSEFGFRELGGGKQHNGIDISGTPWGSDIYAANSGTVVYVYSGCANDGYYGSPCGGGYGNQVIINHGNNVYTIYAHIMKDITVKEGDRVSKGQVIGYMADSGSSTGTHLHFGVSIGHPRQGGRFSNPRTLYRK